MVSKKQHSHLSGEHMRHGSATAAGVLQSGATLSKFHTKAEQLAIGALAHAHHCTDPGGVGALQAKAWRPHLKMVMARQVSMMAWLMRLLMRSTSASRSVPRNTCVGSHPAALSAMVLLLHPLQAPGVLTGKRLVWYAPGVLHLSRIGLCPAKAFGACMTAEGSLCCTQIACWGAG